MKDLMSQKIDLILNTSAASDFTGYMRSLKKGSGIFVQIGAPESEIKLSYAEILYNEWTFTGSAASKRRYEKNVGF
jgi:D-arabinose 1-dehydrogenase-like Zn-dependent alcohol dehydrogenase